MFTLVSEADGKMCLHFDGGSMNVHIFGGHKLQSLIKLKFLTPIISVTRIYSKQIVMDILKDLPTRAKFC